MPFPSYLETPIEYLKGIGPQRADLLKKELQVFIYKDLLYHFPFRYADRSKFYMIKDINEEMPHIQIKGKIYHIELVGKRPKQRLQAYLKDSTANIELIWFQGIKWIKDNLQVGVEYIVFGKPSLFKGKINIIHPELDIANEKNINRIFYLQPFYSTTEKLKTKGFDSKSISKCTFNLIENLPNIKEPLPDNVIKELKLISYQDAVRNIHFPSGLDKLHNAEFRLKFEELLYIQLKILRVKLHREEKAKGYIFERIGDYFNNFYKNNLPFELTRAQKKVLKEIRQDLGSGKQMNRLLQGDVGSGKTLVALMSMLMALDNGLQACMMAPTEILAMQHYETVLKMLNKLNIEVRLLTGATKSKERKEILAGIKNNSIQILIGTHALIEDDVQFQKLGLAVIDEQHRFGVEQRARLWQKVECLPHVLVMTATPIPRTLAMTLYGDLDVSIIDEMPVGRKPIKTIHRYESGRLQVFGFIKEQIKLGRQVYIVYPLIQESEKMDYKNLMDGFESISRAFPLPAYKVSIVHGQMKSADKEYEMQRFLKGETNIMVATTVIEVGVNVPNASVMVIESAEKFGLSQLHQLRGRVGRGAEQSYCILITGNKLSKEAKLRLNTMVRTTDGFEIADTDLKLRGPGDISGIQQSGILNLHIADLAKDAHILQLARQIAIKILREDPHLESKENESLKKNLEASQYKNTNWSKVS